MADEQTRGAGELSRVKVQDIKDQNLAYDLMHCSMTLREATDMVRCHRIKASRTPDPRVNELREALQEVFSDLDKVHSLAWFDKASAALANTGEPS